MVPMFIPERIYDECGEKRVTLWLALDPDFLQGIARRLVKTALQEAAKKREMRYSDLKKIDRGVRRHFHDDITVVVVFLDSNLVSRASTLKCPTLSMKGGGISLPAKTLAPSEVGSTWVLPLVVYAVTFWNLCLAFGRLKKTWGRCSTNLNFFPSVQCNIDSELLFCLVVWTGKEVKGSGRKGELQTYCRDSFLKIMRLRIM